MALEGTANTPFGKVQKKTLVIGGVGLVGIMGIAWYRSKKTAAVAAGSDTSAASQAIDPTTGLPYADESGSPYDSSSGNLDPATGYPYGSSEDENALQALSQYPGYQGYGGNFPSNPYPLGGNPASGQFTTNAAWAQYAENYLIETQGGDAATIGNALGKYLTGVQMTADQQSIVQNAIAIAGFPPVAGPDGKPPAFASAPPAPTPHPHPKSTITVIANGHEHLREYASKHKNTYAEAKKLNPWAHRFTVKNRPIPKGYKIHLYKR